MSIPANVYVVRVSLELVVVAGDEKEACKVAKKNVEAELHGCEYDAEFVRRITQVPYEWRSSLPYGNEAASWPQPTVAELVDARHEEFCQDPHCERCAHLGGFAKEVEP